MTTTKFECEYCGEELDREPSPPIICDSGPFRGERYCSKKCQRDARNCPADYDGLAEARQLGFTGLD